MPAVPFAALPDSARVWVFASDRSLDQVSESRLLAEVDAFLEQWQAHGLPLRGAREWRDGRFLAVGVDQRDAHASGCSIDGLFRALQRLQPELGAQLVGGGRVFFRDRTGDVDWAQRGDVRSRAEAGELGADTAVFDTSVTSAADYRERFERPARETWVGELIKTV